jgi:signal peptide peptidase SppA
MPTTKSPTGCRSDQLFGLWLIAPEQLEAYRRQVSIIDLEALARFNAEAEAAELREPVKPGDPPKDQPKPLYVNDNGVAVVEVSGPTTKYPTSFSRIVGGTSTMMVEKALLNAGMDKDVKSILIHFDGAPGGTVAGAFELVDRIRAVKGKKPIHAHISDQGTSAAYLFASACDKVTANRNAVVGSIGTRAQLVDTSEKLKRDGIKVIPIAAGKYKAAGLDGTPITSDQVKDFQRQINAMNDQFIADVVRGRPGLTEAKVRGMEARCYIGNEALALGLIDAVASFGDVLGWLQDDKTASGVSGIPNAILKPAAPFTQRSVRMDMLTELRELFGAAEMSEEQAVAKVRSLKADASAATALRGEVDGLKKANAELEAFRPKAPDMEALRDRADLTEGRIDVAVAKQELPPVLATKLQGLVMKDGKPNPFWLTTVAGIEARPIDAVLGMFAGEKLGGPAAGSTTAVQSGTVLSREVPGEDPNAAKAPTQEQIDAHLAMTALGRRALAARKSA